MLIQQQRIHQNRSIYRFDYPKVVIQIKNFLNLDHQIGISKLYMNEYINQPQRTNLFIYKEDENFRQIHIDIILIIKQDGHILVINMIVIIDIIPKKKHKYLMQQEKYIESKQFLIIVKSLSD